MCPQRIEIAAEPTAYCAEIDCEGNIANYRFKVRKNGTISGIVWDDQLWNDTGGELHPARPLFQSIGKLHELSKLLQH